MTTKKRLKGQGEEENKAGSNKFAKITPDIAPFENSYDILTRTISSINVSDVDYKSVFNLLVGNEEAFFSGIWEKSPCHFIAEGVSQSSLKKYKKVFSKNQLLDIINESTLPIDTNINAFKYEDGQRTNVPFEDVVLTSSEVTAKLNDGVTLQFFQPQRFSDSLHIINAGFEHTFGSLAGASTYLTPPSVQGLAPHHDDVCVFVIQTEGSKMWHLWPNKNHLPEHHSDDILREDLPNECAELIMRTGDVLYLPRGTIHEAIALDLFSTHVTVSVYQKYNFKTLLSTVINKALEDAFLQDIELRQGLPRHLNELFGTFVGSSNAQASDVSENRSSYMKKIVDSIEKLASNISLDIIDKSADSIVTDFAVNRLPPPASAADALYQDDEVGNRVNEKSNIRILDRHCCFYSIEELEGVQLIALSHNKNNIRMNHMGHPSFNTDEEAKISGQGEGDDERNGNEDEGDESGDDDGTGGKSESDMVEETEDEDEEEQGAVEVNLHLPVRLMPLVQFLLDAYPSGHNAVSRLCEQMDSEHRIQREEVLEALNQMDIAGFIDLQERG